jgi:hypothetical protein
MSTGRGLAGLIGRSIEEELFLDPANTRLRATTHTGSVYQIELGAPLEPAETLVYEDMRYTLRPATFVVREGEPLDGAAFVGYSVDGGTLIVLGERREVLQRSSTIAELEPVA